MRASAIAIKILATLLSLFIIIPQYEIVYSSLKYITGSYPYALVRTITGTEPAHPFKPYRQTSPKTVIKSNVPITTDSTFDEQKSSWKPVETYRGDDDDSYYSDEYTEDSMNPFLFQFFKYLMFLLSSIRHLALNALQESHVFARPEAILKHGMEQVGEFTPGGRSNKSESLRRICEVLQLSGIDYKACESLEQPITVARSASLTPWTEEDQYGIRWKEVSEDKGCFYFIKADSIPLKINAMPNKDGTTSLSYYTKNTIGEYCPKSDNPAEIEKFYQEFFEGLMPTALTVFLNTKLFMGFTVYDLFEFQLLINACLIALYKTMQTYGGGRLSIRGTIGFLVVYGFAYSTYYFIFK